MSPIDKLKRKRSKSRESAPSRSPSPKMDSLFLDYDPQEGPSNKTYEFTKENIDPALLQQLVNMADNKSMASLEEFENKCVSHQRQQEAFLDSLCREFREMQTHVGKVKDVVDNLEEDNRKIKDLDYNSINYGKAFDVLPPTEFSPTDVLKNNKERETLFLHYFPYANQSRKYDGKLMPVRDFLRNVNRAQERINLSEKEFKTELLAATQGEIRDHLDVWVDSGDSLKDIYFKFLQIYDHRMTPLRATQLLDSFRITKNMTLADINTKIAKLASLANAHYKDTAYRHFRTNEMSIKKFFNALPKHARFLAQYQHSKLLKNLGKSPTFAELMKQLRLCQEQIEDDIRNNAIPSDRYRQRPRNSFNRFKPLPNFVPKTNTVTTYNNNNNFPQRKTWNSRPSNSRGNFKRGNTSFRPSPNFNNYRKQDSSSQFVKKNNDSTTSNYNSNFQKPSNRGNFTNQRSRGNRGNRWNSNRSYYPRNNTTGRNFSSANTTPLGTDRSLCGIKGHSWLKCTNMKTDQGKLITIGPTSEPCKKCPKNVGPLRHPEKFCPYRPKGPWAHKNPANKKD